LRNLAAALGLVLFAVYLLTASGHTYSPDEESLLYVAQSFIAHGEFNIPDPDQYPVTGGHRGEGGRIFSGTGLAQSLLALPFFVAASEIARAFDPHSRDFILRLVVVSLFNAILSALTGILLYGWLRRLRVSTRISAALVLVWAFATMAWVYARTFFSEPLLTFCFVLAGYALCVYHDTRAVRWTIVAGLAAGLAVLTKAQGLLVLPALGLYFIALELPVLLGKGTSAPPSSIRMARGMSPLFWSALILPGILFIAGLAVGLVLTGYFDFIRFGDPLQTGRGEVSQGFPILTGLFGLLLSSGKSDFLYAPPIVLFFLALPRFFRRHAAEAWFCVVFIATFVLFHARLEIWSGDGAWGPRYLVSTLPFWLMPASVILGEWWHGSLRRAFVVALVAAGLFVNVLGLTINFDTYIQIQPNANARYFNPAAAPLLWQWNLLSERVGAWWGDTIASQDAVTLVKGFLATGSNDVFPRYLAPRALVLVKSNSAQPLQMSLFALDYRPQGKEKRTLVFLANGEPLESQLLPAAESGYLEYRVQIPAATARWAAIDIVTLGSQPVGKSPMGDELGVHLQSLDVAAIGPSSFDYRSVGSGQAPSSIDYRSGGSGRMLRVLNDVVIPPLPTADPKAMWAWFYEPTNSQFDFLWWYLYFTGLGDAQVAAIISAMASLGILCLVASAPTIWRVLKRGEGSSA
jgi:hypothetical protein